MESPFLLVRRARCRLGRTARAIFTDSSPIGEDRAKSQRMLTVPLRSPSSLSPLKSRLMDSIWLTGLTDESRQEILQHLRSVLEDRRFAAAERNAGFLRCVVEKALAGRTDEIKETIIAMEVYGRSAGYDFAATTRMRAETLRSGFTFRAGAIFRALSESREPSPSQQSRASRGRPWPSRCPFTVGSSWPR